MSTRSLIGKVLDIDKSPECKVIYCHNDGYMEQPGVGWYLQNFYKNEEDVDALLELGDLSTLGENPISDPDLWANLDNSYQKCRTYKGRGDTDVEARIYKNPRTAIKEEPQNYHYFYIDGKWYCIPGNKEAIDLETGEIIKGKVNECLMKESEEQDSSFIELPGFIKHWKELGLTETNKNSLKKELKQNPDAGDLIQGTGGARKLRIKLNNNKGKSHGARVIYYYFKEGNTKYLIMIYAKKEKASLSNEDKNNIKKLIDIIKK